MPAGALAAPPKFVRLLAVTVTVAALGGCSQVGDVGTLSPLAQSASETQAASADPHRATEASAKALVSNPRDLKAQLAHARNLKQLGDKSAAMAVLQAASEVHGTDRELASEYGRLAADLDQLSLASKLLAVAEDPARPDWRVISARGTVLAKQGKYDDALPLFERALALDPGNPSLINNLALARAASGDAAGAESLLRQAAAARPADSRIRNNLALVEKIQGRTPAAQPAAAAPAPEPVRAAAAAPRPAAPAPAAGRAAPAPVQPTPVVASAAEPPRAPAPVRVAPPAPAVAAVPVQAPSAPAPAVAGWTMRVDPAPVMEAAPPVQTVAPARTQPIITPSVPVVAATPEPAPSRPVVVGWSADVSAERAPQVPAPAMPTVTLAAPPAAEEPSRPVELPSAYWRPVRK